MTLKGIDKEILHTIFSQTSKKDVMKWCNAMDPTKVMN